jgi:hypothetical protein
MLHAYLDDSGSHDQSPFLVLAGYFGSEAQWNKFDRRWRAVIEAVGLREFHANRFWAHCAGRPIPEYSGWDNQKCNQFISKLVEIIGSHRISPVSSTVVTQEWSALPQDERAFLTGAGYDDNATLTSSGAANKRFFVPFIWTVQSALRYCNPGHTMHFSFDRNDLISGYAADYFKYVKTLWAHRSPKLGDLSFVESEEASPIQAADLLAYETRRYIIQKVNVPTTQVESRSILGRILQNMRDPHDCLFLDRKGLNLMLREYRTAKAEASHSS